MPQAVCLATCKETPSPAPTVPQYNCDLDTKTCTLCPSGDCPGSMPQAHCEALCPNPYPGPTPNLIGVWRGIYIQNDYSIGEIDIILTASGATVYKDGTLYYQATIISLGSDVMIFTITTGQNAGKTYGTLYQLAIQDYGMYTNMIMAMGGYDLPGPVDFNTPMYTSGMREVVLTGCDSAPCTFPNP